MLAAGAKQRMDMEQMRLQRVSQKIPSLFSLVKERHENNIALMLREIIAAAQLTVSVQRHKLDAIHGSLGILPERIITGEKHRLQMLGQRAMSLDPELLLKRGYSITTHEGKVVRDVSGLKPGDSIETRVEKGSVRSTVVSRKRIRKPGKTNKIL